MRSVDVVKTRDQWVARSAGEVVVSADTKVEAVRGTAAWAKNQHEPVAVRIHGQSGRIQEERTYSQRAYPRLRRG